jgi:hypothetical protein
VAGLLVSLPRFRGAALSVRGAPLLAHDSERHREEKTGSHHIVVMFLSRRLL